MAVADITYLVLRENGMTVQDALVSRRNVLQAAGSVMGLAALSPLLAACGGNDKGSGGKASALDMGVIKPATGTLAAAYGPLFAAADLAVKEINDAGGILGQKIKTTTFNDQGNVANEGSAANQLLSAKKSYALGPVGTSPVLASYAVTQKRGKVIQCCETMSPSVNDPKQYPGGFSPLIQSKHAAELFASYLVTTLSRKKIGLMLENTGYGTEGSGYFKDAVGPLGAEIVGTETYDQGSNTQQSNLLRLKSANIDGLMVWGTTPADITAIFTAIQQLGIDVPVACSASFATYLAKLVPNLSQGILDSTFLVVNRTFTFGPNESASQEVLDYSKKLFSFGNIAPAVQFSAIQGPYYDFIYLLKRAIESVKTTDYDKVLEALETLGPYKGKVGTINFTSSDHVGLGDDAYTVAKASGLLNEELSQGWMVERVS